MTSQTGIRLIAGLGNPGAEYQNNRHNAGFWFIDYLAYKYRAEFKTHAKLKSAICNIALSGQSARLVKPNVYMNISGQALAAVVHFYKLSMEQVLVVHDEIDFETAKMRIKYSGGHGGHNGLLDIIRHLGKDFWRLRIGIGHPGSKAKVASYVLADPKTEEHLAIEAYFSALSTLVEDMVIGEFQRAMEVLHRQT